MIIKKENIVCLILNNTPKVILSDEHIDYKWISLSELDELFNDKKDLMYKMVRRIL